MMLKVDYRTREARLDSSNPAVAVAEGPLMHLSLWDTLDKTKNGLILFETAAIEDT